MKLVRSGFEFPHRKPGGSEEGWLLWARQSPWDLWRRTWRSPMGWTSLVLCSMHLLGRRDHRTMAPRKGSESIRLPCWSSLFSSNRSCFRQVLLGLTPRGTLTRLRPYGPRIGKACLAAGPLPSLEACGPVRPVNDLVRCPCLEGLPALVDCSAQKSLAFPREHLVFLSW
ncbi:hypothetical protein B0T11DRAFT_278160 [Plectosphaerella cucumerina]|uniref:Uncharacterized protein n=1 Tax=Plectosphaerella cucumerina TaxID=40658 RepID=A0A8K0X6N5_9PEZI|nr:hypothetical protein B0T11DRAFT_278160 [Plectosphaerella cucumerina]